MKTAHSLRGVYSVALSHSSTHNLKEFHFIFRVFPSVMSKTDDDDMVKTRRERRERFSNSICLTICVIHYIEKKVETKNKNLDSHAV